MRHRRNLLSVYSANSDRAAEHAETAETCQVFEFAERSEEHTSELQSQSNLVCRLLLETTPPATYPLSLHDALPIFWRSSGAARQRRAPPAARGSAVPNRRTCGTAEIC